MIKILRKHHRDFYSYRHDFYCVFAVSLKTYFDFRTGFELTEFDRDVVKSTDGVSMETAVRKRYGKEGVRIINALIS